MCGKKYQKAPNSLGRSASIAHLDPPRLPKSNDEPPPYTELRLERRRSDFCGAAIRYAEPRKCVTPGHLQSLLLTFFSFGIGDAEFREAVTECVPGKTQGAGGLALISIGAAEGFADRFIFPFVERHAGRQGVA